MYWSRLRPLPGAADLLRACRRHGLQVVLASSADPGELDILRAALDADDAIDEATSAGDVDQSKPAPDLVEVALDKAGLDAGEAVFAGDAVWDAQACWLVSPACPARAAQPGHRPASSVIRQAMTAPWHAATGAVMSWLADPGSSGPDT